MCGIVGYIGEKQALPIVIKGLERLEYRGYDSAGVLIYDKQKKEVYFEKQPGRIKNLIRMIDPDTLGTLGIGHCLHPKTVIQLSNGQTLYIKDIKKRQSIINLDPKKLCLSRGSVEIFSHISPPHLYRVRTAISDFIATGNHKTLVYSKGIIKEKMINELTNKDLLPLPKEINISQRKNLVFEAIFVKRYYRLGHKGHQFIFPLLKEYTKRKISTAAKISESYIDHFMRNDRNFREDKITSLLKFLNQDKKTFLDKYCQPVNTIHGKHINFPALSSPALMQILGYFVGDGYAGERSLRFKDMDEDLLKVYEWLIFREFNVMGKIGLMNDTAAKLLEVNSSYLCQWLKRNIKNNLYNFISKIGSLPKPELSSFIKGLFDAEAGIGEQSKQLLITTNNEFLMRSLQLWLLQFGIISSLRIEKPNVKQKRKNFAFKLSVSNKDSLQKFQKIIGFNSQRKKIKLEKIIKDVGDKHFSYRLLRDHDEIFLSKIKEIKRIKSDCKSVYDLEVNNNANFLANSIFTHNSRWATHGQVNKANAHPHYDCQKKIFVVHNGIIENFQEIKDSLIQRGHKFSSETDTEVFPHLLEELIKEGLSYEQAIIQALKKIKGSFAFLIFNKDYPDMIVGARFSSPLMLGIGNKEFILASDQTAISLITNKVVYLNDGDIVFVKNDDYKIKSFMSETVSNQEGIIAFSSAETEKGKFPDYMIKEIFDEPKAVEDTLRGRLLIEEGNVKLGGLDQIADKLKEIDNILITGCGTAFYAAKLAEYFFEEYAQIPTKADLASELRYRMPVVSEKTLLVSVSQSGETADTLAVIKELKARGILTVGITNVVGSSIARLVDAGIYSHAGPELAVASTKAFLAQIADLILLMVYLARQRKMDKAKAKEILAELDQIHRKIQETIVDNDQKADSLAQKYLSSPNFLYIGRKYSFPIALEGSLKLKEVSYVHAEGLASGEVKHGSIALIEEGFPTVIIAPQDLVYSESDIRYTKPSVCYEKTISNLEEIKARKGKIIVITTKGNKKLEKLADDVIYIPKTLELLSPLLSIVPLHLFAYYFAKKLGRDVDRPRNLAKSVTVE